jgi:hypothetical protein
MAGPPNAVAPSRRNDKDSAAGRGGASVTRTVHSSCVANGEVRLAPSAHREGARLRYPRDRFAHGNPARLKRPFLWLKATGKLPIPAHAFCSHPAMRGLRHAPPRTALAANLRAMPCGLGRRQDRQLLQEADRRVPGPTPRRVWSQAPVAVSVIDRDSDCRRRVGVDTGSRGQLAWACVRPARELLPGLRAHRAEFVATRLLPARRRPATGGVDPGARGFGLAARRVTARNSGHCVDRARRRVRDRYLPRAPLPLDEPSHSPAHLGPATSS